MFLGQLHNHCSPMHRGHSLWRGWGRGEGLGEGGRGRGGGIGGAGAKICYSVFIQYSLTLVKNGKLLINLQFTPL